MTTNFTPELHDANASLTSRLSTAYRIVKGSRVADPLFVELHNKQHILTTIDAIIKRVLPDYKGDTLTGVRELATELQSTRIAVSARKVALDDATKALAAAEKEARVLKEKLAATDHDTVKLLDKDTTITKQAEEIADLNHQIEALREAAEAAKARHSNELANVNTELAQVKEEKDQRAAKHRQEFVDVNHQLTQVQAAYDKLVVEITALVSKINAKIEHSHEGPNKGINPPPLSSTEEGRGFEPPYPLG